MMHTFILISLQVGLPVCVDRATFFYNELLNHSQCDWWVTICNEVKYCFSIDYTGGNHRQRSNLLVKQCAPVTQIYILLYSCLFCTKLPTDHPTMETGPLVRLRVISILNDINNNSYLTIPKWLCSMMQVVEQSNNKKTTVHYSNKLGSSWILKRIVKWEMINRQSLEFPWKTISHTVLNINNNMVCFFNKDYICNIIK